MSDGAKKVNPDGRRLQSSEGKKIVCGCCGSCQTFYKAEFCNTGCCSSWNYEVFICTEYVFTCDPYGDRPLETGDIIGGEVNGKWYCFRVSTSTVYCADESCEPALPKGANILDPATTECRDNCNHDQCPPNPCYYPMGLCSCSPNLPAGAQAWVKCEALHDAQAASGAECPVWGIALGGIGYCLIGRETVPTELPDPLPPLAIVIESGFGAVANCCECCGFASDLCCWVDWVPFRETWHADCTRSVEYFDHEYCCGSVDSWTLNIEGSIEVINSNGCTQTLYTWSGSISPGQSGGILNYHYIEYNGECPPSISYEGDGTIPIQRCHIGIGIETPGDCQFPCGTQSGYLEMHCTHGSAHIEVSNLACGGGGEIYDVSYSIESEDGVCGNNGCAPPPGDVLRAALTTVPARHDQKRERRGCQGCRRKRA